MFKLSKSSKKNMEGVHYTLQAVANRAIEITKVDFGIPETGGLRSADVQHVLYLEGSSKCDGYKVKSYHQTGRALDFFAYDGGATWDDLKLAMVATAFLQAASELGVKLKWGGNFKSFKDFPHVELVE